MAANMSPADGNSSNIPPNRCDVDAVSPARIEPTMLTMFAPPMEPADFISRTAAYARDPGGYLQSTLGPETFAARKGLLSLPPGNNVDRDAYGTGKHKAHFEKHIANLLGKTNGLFFLTGVQAQLAALKIHCDRAGNRRVAWHVTSHLEEAEQGAWRELYGLERRLVGSKEDALPTVEEISEVVSLPEEERPAVLLIEVPNRTLGCATYEFEELEKISKMCQKNGVKLHCDGARLWEIESYYGVSSAGDMTEIGDLFDTVYVSFYKGLAGVTGAMLLCSGDSFEAEARTWQRRAGGNPHTLMYEIVDCERGFNENIGTFHRKWQKMKEVVEGIKAATEGYQTEDGKPVITFLTDPPTCCQGRVMFQGFTARQLDAARDRVLEHTGVKLYNRLWPKQTLDQKLDAEKAKALHGGGATVQDGNDADERVHVIEWMIMSVTEKIPTQTFVDGYAAFCEALFHAD